MGIRTLVTCDWCSINIQPVAWHFLLQYDCSGHRRVDGQEDTQDRKTMVLCEPCANDVNGRIVDLFNCKLEHTA